MSRWNFNSKLTVLGPEPWYEKIGADRLNGLVSAKVDFKVSEILSGYVGRITNYPFYPVFSLYPIW
jgi:hypothetical protein